MVAGIPTETFPLIQNIVVIVSVTVAVVAIFWLILGAIRSGVVREVTFGTFGLRGTVSVGQTTAEQLRRGRVSAADEPFEATALASYYNQALLSSTISFWFSLIFASIGFVVIILAFATHSSDDLTGTIIKIVSGTVIDAVSGLFFVQSNNAREAMGKFFEKLRLDRLNAEAREMVNSIESVERRDQLRMQLILKYSEIDKLIVQDAVSPNMQVGGSISAADQSQTA